MSAKRARGQADDHLDHLDHRVSRQAGRLREREAGRPMVREELSETRLTRGGDEGHGITLGRLPHQESAAPSRNSPSQPSSDQKAGTL